MSDDVLEFRVESLEEDVKDLKALSAQIMKKVIMAGIGVISIVITGSSVMI